MGTKFKVILGFSSQSERGLAMERGEIQGQCGTYLSSIKATNMQQVDSGQLRLIWQMGSEAHPDFSSVPLAIDYAKTDRARHILKMFFATMAIGRATALPPDVPADRVAILRAAYDATMGDPAFLAEAAKQKMEIRALSAKDMAPALNDLLGHPPAIYADAAAILRNAASRAKEPDKAKP
jgi:tripartite-type tricarboxylate transporter receptor subunit TctC